MLPKDNFFVSSATGSLTIQKQLDLFWKKDRFRCGKTEIGRFVFSLFVWWLSFSGNIIFTFTWTVFVQKSQESQRIFCLSFCMTKQDLIIHSLPKKQWNGTLLYWLWNSYYPCVWFSLNFLTEPLSLLLHVTPTLVFRTQQLHSVFWEDFLLIRF